MGIIRFLQTHWPPWVVALMVLYALFTVVVTVLFVAYALISWMCRS